MIVAVYKKNGNLLAICSSIPEASRLFRVPVGDIVRVIIGKKETASPLDGRKKKFGPLVFRELDNEKDHSMSGRS